MIFVEFCWNQLLPVCVHSSSFISLLLESRDNKIYQLEVALGKEHQYDNCLIAGTWSKLGDAVGLLVFLLLSVMLYTPYKSKEHTL